MESAKLISLLENNRNKKQALKMSAYMRDQFAFLGIPTPQRKNICKDFFRIAAQENQPDWGFIKTCWEKPYREFQYVAVDYLSVLQKTLTPNDIPKLKALAVQKSWWDTIDGLDRIIGSIALHYPEVNQILLQWSTDKSFWLRRIAIDHQLLRKEKTNTELLTKIIVNNFGQTEFFINKAIGWSLRDYSKTNPEWVRRFVQKYHGQLAPLSLREASKYL